MLSSICGMRSPIFLLVKLLSLLLTALNLLPSMAAERIGRKKVFLLGWTAALPVPLLVYFAPSWSWIVAATVLLGINQGLTWSMTQASKFDITRACNLGSVYAGVMARPGLWHRSTWVGYCRAFQRASGGSFLVRRDLDVFVRYNSTAAW
jgi:hypothetical protein